MHFSFSAERLRRSRLDLPELGERQSEDHGIIADRLRSAGSIETHDDLAAFVVELGQGKPLLHLDLVFCSAFTSAVMSADDPPLMRWISSLGPNMEKGLLISVVMKSTMLRLD
jgi:hypothetical protein